MNKKINVLSLFDGISVARQALKDANIEVDNFYSSEIDKNAIIISKHNHKENIHLGDVKKVSYFDNNLTCENNIISNNKIDLLIGGSPCFIKDTKVITKEGYKNIQDISIGDEVLTHLGRYKKVLKIGGKKKQQIYKIKSVSSINIYTTKEHPFLTSHDMGSMFLPNIPKHSAVDWETVENLKQDFHYLCNVNEIKNEKVVTFSFEPNCKDETIGEMVGFLKTKNLLKIENYKNNEYINYLNNKVQVYEDLLFSDENIKKLLIDNNGKFILNQSLEFQKGYLNGLLISKITKDSVEKFTIHKSKKNYLLLIQKLLFDLYNKQITLKQIDNKYKIKSISDYFLNKKPMDNLEDVFKFDKNLIYGFNVLEIKEKLNLFEDVFNLEVEEDNSYTANNIVVHNCQSFSFAGKRKGMVTKDNIEVLNLKQYLDLKNQNFEFEGQSYLFWEYVRLLKEVKPKYFLLENVEMDEKWENLISKTLGVKPLKINSSLFTCQNRPRLYWTNINSNIDNIANKKLTFESIKQKESNESHYYSGKAIDWLVNHSLRLYQTSKNIKKLRIYNDNTIVNTITLSHNKKYSGQRFFAILDNTFIRKDQVDRIKEIYEECNKTGNFDKLMVLTDWEKVKNGEYCYRFITPEECELAQGLPLNYTKCVSNTARYKGIGNGFTVPVISFILKKIKKSS